MKKIITMKKFIIILFGVLFFSVNTHSQKKKITIRVKDANNKPVAGAIILFDNVKQKVWTNSNGVFKTKFKVAPKEISAFHPKIGIIKVKYNGRVNILLKIKKGNDAHLVSNTPKQKNASSSQFNTIYDYLRGKIPGVHVSSDNTIAIRGYNSINGNMTPLFILNGTNISQEVFGRIIPHDINSITVLKGPDTTIYGIRGANGVIVVKTK
jgi:TonB-dependent SusC/RagA subfamily outer membrane receptor